MAWILWLFILLGGSLGLLTLAGISRRGLARWKGTPVDGRITDSWEGGGGRAGRYYRVTYSYTVAGRAYAKKQYVSKEHYRDWEDCTTPVQVLCLANHPTVAVLAEDNANFLANVFTAIMLFGITVFLLKEVLH